MTPDRAMPAPMRGRSRAAWAAGSDYVRAATRRVSFAGLVLGSVAMQCARHAKGSLAVVPDPR